MADRGIIFSAPMVRALLDGRKTQTRRLLMTSDEIAKGPWVRVRSHPVGWQVGLEKFNSWKSIKVPYAPGDRLYVREGWAIKRFEPCLPHERDWQSLNGPVVRYLSDGSEIEHQGDRSTGRGIYHGVVEKGRPSIHMPRWASRLWLSVTEVRVQRLQDISGSDAVAEGVRSRLPDNGIAQQEYADLWNTLHTAPGETWGANPWVCAVSFDVHHGNIDEAGHADQA